MAPLRVCAQGAASAPAPSSVVAGKDDASRLPFDLKVAQGKVLALFLKGAYDEAIEEATKALESAKDDRYLLYFRGRAEFAIGFYGAARHDMVALRFFQPYSNWDTAQFYIYKIDKLNALAPLHTFEVRDDAGHLTFRVYYDVENNWSHAIVSLLPEALRINQSLLGRGLKEQPIFIFTDERRFGNFISTHSGAPPASWAWAVGGLGALCFCQGHNNAPQDTGTPYFRGSIVHELNHALVKRITGDAPMPRWFEEGLAINAEGTIAPEEEERFSTGFQKTVEADALLPLQSVTDDADFQKGVEQQAAQTAQGDPYAQGWSMARFFLSLVPPEKITPFLEEVRESRDFGKTLQHFTVKTPDEFFEAWQAQVRR